jgi:hypothetical protein
MSLLPTFSLLFSMLAIGRGIKRLESIISLSREDLIQLENRNGNEDEE